VKDSMNAIEALRRASAELGDVPAQELAVFIGERYGVKILPQFIPVVRASLRELELLEKARKAAREAAPKATGAEQGEGKGRGGDAGQGNPSTDAPAPSSASPDPESPGQP
jgi:hypothetical protein